jgi:hypothetical protein
MDVNCHACLSGPCGFMGHADLMAQTVGDHRISFKCRLCHLFWTRSIARDGGFAWTVVSEQVAYSPALGVIVPPRADPQRARMLPPRSHT